MCGRFTLRRPTPEWLTDLFPEFKPSAHEIIEQLERSEPSLLVPRYNIAPSQSVWIAYRNREMALPAIVPMHWGLVPSWADSLAIGSRMINARSETLAEKPAFRKLFAAQRCVVIADGYYEWRKTGAKTKQPYWIHRPSERSFAMAGLWAINTNVQPREPWMSTTIITTQANASLTEVHERMPVILESHEAIARWLDPTLTETDRLLPLLQPASESLLQVRPVSTRVNKPTEDDPSLIAEAT